MSKIKRIIWSDPKPADGKSCFYDHVVGTSALGDFMITWKSWKDHQSFNIESPDGRWVESSFSLEDAKTEAQCYFDELISKCLED